MRVLRSLLSSYLALIAFYNIVLSVETNDGYCMLSCGPNSAVDCKDILFGDKYIFYDVNPPEGFNLRRDVYMRMAIFVHNIVKKDKYRNIKLVLPPWNDLYHWRSKDIGLQRKIPWSLFFDVASLKKFAPVVELHEVFSEEPSVTIDNVYMLEHFPNAFEDGNFEDKLEVVDPEKCNPPDELWGYSNISVSSHECVFFQGSTSLLEQVMATHPSDQMLMFTNTEVALHDEYGTKIYWDARRSMKFNADLIKIAETFIKKELSCFKAQCDNYVAVHWRRGDFAKSRYKQVPSIGGTAKQILNKLNDQFKSLIKTVFIATDSNNEEFQTLVELLKKNNIIVKRFIPDKSIRAKYKDGGVAIIDQIICSHSAYFVGTHESTFTFRIQEEREIIGFDSDTTFNRLCPDTGECERMSRWRVVN